MRLFRSCSQILRCADPRISRNTLRATRSAAAPPFLSTNWEKNGPVDQDDCRRPGGASRGGGTTCRVEGRNNREKGRVVSRCRRARVCVYFYHVVLSLQRGHGGGIVSADAKRRHIRDVRRRGREAAAAGCRRNASGAVNKGEEVVAEKKSKQFKMLRKMSSEGAFVIIFTATKLVVRDTS